MVGEVNLQSNIISSNVATNINDKKAKSAYNLFLTI